MGGHRSIDLLDCSQTTFQHIADALGEVIGRPQWPTTRRCPSGRFMKNTGRIGMMQEIRR